MVKNGQQRKLISLAEAADYLGVSVKTARRYVAAGKLPAHRVGGRLIRIDVPDLDRMLTPMGGAA